MWRAKRWDLPLVHNCCSAHTLSLRPLQQRPSDFDCLRSSPQGLKRPLMLERAAALAHWPASTAEADAVSQSRHSNDLLHCHLTWLGSKHDPCRPPVSDHGCRFHCWLPGAAHHRRPTQQQSPQPDRVEVTEADSGERGVQGVVTNATKASLLLARGPESVKQPQRRTLAVQLTADATNPSLSQFWGRHAVRTWSWSSPPAPHG